MHAHLCVNVRIEHCATLHVHGKVRMQARIHSCCVYFFVYVYVCTVCVCASAKHTHTYGYPSIDACVHACHLRRACMMHLSSRSFIDSGVHYFIDSTDS